MAICKISGVEVPYVFNVKPGYGFRGDRGDTALGATRQDVAPSAIKRKWTVQTKYMSQGQLVPILAKLEEVSFGVVKLWLAEFGSETNTVDVYIYPEEIDITEYDGYGYPNLRALSFTAYSVR